MPGLRAGCILRGISGPRRSRACVKLNRNNSNEAGRRESKAMETGGDHNRPGRSGAGVLAFIFQDRERRREMEEAVRHARVS